MGEPAAASRCTALNRGVGAATINPGHERAPATVPRCCIAPAGVVIHVTGCLGPRVECGPRPRVVGINQPVLVGATQKMRIFSSKSHLRRNLTQLAHSFLQCRYQM